MKRTAWKGPKGTIVIIDEGSRQPQRWALLLIDRVQAREHRIPFGGLHVRYRHCSRGCAHGYGRPGYGMSLFVTGRKDEDLPLILHELAHVYNYAYRDRHGPGFYRTLYRIAKAEGRLRLMADFQNNKAAWRRARRAVEG